VILRRREFREFGDKIESEKSRDFRAIEARVANYRQTQDWMARAAGIELADSRIASDFAAFSSSRAREMDSKCIGPELVLTPAN
jgi:hypothetical protein